MDLPVKGRFVGGGGEAMMEQNKEKHGKVVKIIFKESIRYKYKQNISVYVHNYTHTGLHESIHTRTMYDRKQEA